jgi:hypothetical protein
MDFITAQCLQQGYPPLACFLVKIMAFMDGVVVPFIMALAFIVFIWGVFQYFIAGGADEEKRTKGRNFVMWGLIGFVLILSLWGVIRLLMNSLGFNNPGIRPDLPTFGTPINVRAPAQQGNQLPRANNNTTNTGNASTVGQGQTCQPGGTPCASGLTCTPVGMGEADGYVCL